MATVSQRAWAVPGRRTKHKAWGYTAVINGQQRRCYKSEWTKEDAQKALSELLLNIEPPKKGPEITLAQAVARYLAAKARKRSIAEDRRLCAHLASAFGSDTQLSAITAGRISEYKAQRLASLSVRRKDEYGQPTRLSAASINRPLAVLRHLLRLAHEEWEVLPAIPKVRMEKEPQGRIRWLEPDEEARLLDACRTSRAKHLAAVVTVALETGLRKSELLGMTWDRVHQSRGVIRIEVTKSARRREIPMRQVVYNVLSSLPHPHEGRVWPSGGQDRQLHIPRLSPPLRLVVRDAGRKPSGTPENPRPRQPGDDHAVRPPRARLSPQRGRQDRAASSIGGTRRAAGRHSAETHSNVISLPK
jgi:integrase